MSTTTREAIRDALTASPDPLTVAEISGGSGQRPGIVHCELIAMELVGEVQRVSPDPDRFWCLTADMVLRAALDSVDLP